MLFKLENSKQDYSKVKRVTLADIGWKEIDLQNLLSKHIQKRWCQGPLNLAPLNFYNSRINRT